MHQVRSLLFTALALVLGPGALFAQQPRSLHQPFFVDNGLMGKQHHALVQEPAVLAVMQTLRGSLYFSAEGLVFLNESPDAQRPNQLRKTRSTLGLTLAGQATRKQAAVPRLVDQQPGVVNYMLGDPQYWRKDVPTFGALVYDHAWDGVDLRFEPHTRGLKLGLTLHPGADAASVILAGGGSGASLDASGTLTLVMGEALMHLAKPTAYQMVDGARQTVSVAWRLLEDGAFGIDLGTVDPQRAVTVTPTLTWLTFYGGAGGVSEAIFDLAVDNNGNIFVSGDTQSGQFDLTTGGHDISQNGETDSFIARFSPDGTQMTGFTYFGGNGLERNAGVGVADDGTVVITGSTRSTNLPVTPDAFDAFMDGVYDGYLAFFSNDLTTLTYATYLGNGRSDQMSYLTVAGDKLFATGRMDGLPLVNPVSSSGDYVVFCMNIADKSFVYSSRSNQYLSKVTANAAGEAFYSHDIYFKFDAAGNQDYFFDGWFDPSIDGAVMDAAGNVVIFGKGDGEITATPGVVYETRPAGLGINDNISFARKLDPDGNTLWTTWLATNVDAEPKDVALDASGNAYFFGHTDANQIATSTGAYQETFSGSQDGFVIKLNSDATALSYATYVGGPNEDTVQAGAVLSDGSVLLVGISSAGFPNTEQPTFDTQDKYYLLRLSPGGDSVPVAHPFAGGYDSFGYTPTVAANGDIYIGGTAGADTFPLSGNTSRGGGYDAFVSRFAQDGALQEAFFFGADTFEQGLFTGHDPQGNLYQFLWTVDSTWNPMGTGPLGSGKFVIKFNPTTMQMEYVRRIIESPLGFPYWTDMQVNDLGEVHLLGGSENFSTGNAAVFVKLDAQGNYIVDGRGGEGAWSAFASDQIVGDDTWDNVTGRFYTRRDALGNPIHVVDHGNGSLRLIPGPGDTYYAVSSSTLYHLDADYNTLESWFLDFNLASSNNFFLRWPIDLTNGQNGAPIIATKTTQPNGISLLQLQPGGDVQQLLKINGEFNDYLYLESNSSGRINLLAHAYNTEATATPGAFDDSIDGFYDMVLIQFDACTGFASDAPEEVTLCEGQSYTLQANAGAESFQWRRDGIDIPGATGSTLTLDPVTLDDAADFSCVLTFDCGTMLTVDTHIVTSVTPAPTVTSQPQDQMVDLGQDAQFSVTGNSNGNGPISYQWQLNGEDILGETNSILNRNNVCGVDGGSYTCILTEACGAQTTSDPAVLTVNTDGDRKMEPASQTADEISSTFNLNLPCYEEEAVRTVTTNPKTPFSLMGDWIVMDPNPSVTTTITASFVDSQGNTLSTSAILLVPANGNFGDANNDGCNGLQDLLLTLPQWNTANAGDANGDGMIDVLDLMYFNAGNTCP